MRFERFGDLKPARQEGFRQTYDKDYSVWHEPPARYGFYALSLRQWSGLSSVDWTSGSCAFGHCDRKMTAVFGGYGNVLVYLSIAVCCGIILEVVCGLVNCREHIKVRGFVRRLLILKKRYGVMI